MGVKLMQLIAALMAARRYMYELGRVVPIVPVICKSDCMTVAEQARFEKMPHGLHYHLLKQG